MRFEADRRIAAIAEGQQGHLTRAQMLGAGIDHSAISRRAAFGLLVRVGAGTFRIAGVPRSIRGDVVAATLEHGGVASHWTAAWLHGLVEPPPVIDVTVVRSGSRNQRVGVGSSASLIRLHSTTSMPAEDVLDQGPLRVSSVARTALDLAALVPVELSATKLEAIISKAVDLKLATDPWLWWLLSSRRCRGRNGVTALEAALAHRAELGPTESWLEREVLRLLSEAGVRLPVTQKVIRRRGRFAARVDFLYEPERVVLEAMGYAHHRTEAQMAADLARANALQLLGFEVYQFVTRQIAGSPEQMIATVRAALGAVDRAA